ncbi:helix-turn-helix domain-containing protein [Kozakia baliensis]|uniref:Uncharacterized protein n=1 Tax=Kozakia baliensis TaxID=153496 RepID=A0A1D8UTS2_9PROT|nr:helix-turn-helix domain-containing protein [Kozakia baliensis]AOX17036.1 hypothetical protein A0U89_07625 [Kozakia baliensis]GEL63905.1 hypothetical protein KBA01_11910 [Kozakia baliensis]
MSSSGARPNRVPGTAESRSGLGMELRARREELGWALPDVANWLRIREAYLQALEDGQSSALPGTAYAVGFLRTYAQALGFDGEEMARRFRRDAHGALDRKPDLTFPQPVSERGVPVGIWIGVGLAVMIGTYIGYYHFMGGEVAPVRHMPPAAELMPGVTEKGTTSPQVAAVMPERGQAPTPQSLPPQNSTPQSPAPQTSMSQGLASQSLPPQSPAAGPEMPQNQAVSATPPPSATPLAPQTEKSATAPDAVQPNANATPGASEAASAAETTDATAPAASENAVALHANADAWVQIRDHNGAVVFSRVLKAGESWQGDASAEPYRMTLGNAGGLVLSAGTVTTPPLGRLGTVRHNLMVTADAVRQGALTSTSTRAAPVAPSGNVSAHVASPPPVAAPEPHLPLKSPSNSETETETDRLNAHQLEQSAQPR